MPPTQTRLLFALLLVITAAAPAQSTLSRIKAANTLSCGLNREEAEYSNLDAHGNRAAFDVDLCKAVAVAILGPGAHFTITPYSDENSSLEALSKGAVDLIPTATPTLTNTAVRRFNFSRTILFDPQALMVNSALNLRTPRDLAGKKICFLVETNLELNLWAYMTRENIAFLPFPFQEEGEMEAAFITGNCAAISADTTQLAYERISFRAMAKNFEILPVNLAQDPLALATRQDDPLLSALVDQVANILIQAEETGLSQTNIDAQTKLRNPHPAPDTDLLLGITAGVGKPFGLDDHWPTHVLQAVGNYGEIFHRDLGSGSPMRLARAQNRLATDGGLLLSTPLR